MSDGTVLSDVPVKYRLAQYRETHDRRVLILLAAHEHVVADDKGRATSVLAEIIGTSVDTATLSNDLNFLRDGGWLEMDRRGKRTYKIELTPQGQETMGELCGIPTPDVIDITDDDSQPVADEEEEQVDIPSDGIDYDALAGALLRRTASILSTTDRRREAEHELRERVAALMGQVRALDGQLSEEQSMNRSLRQANEELSRERAQLRAAVEKMQRQLRGPGVQIKDDERRALERMMRDLPTGR